MALNALADSLGEKPVSDVSPRLKMVFTGLLTTADHESHTVIGGVTARLSGLGLIQASALENIPVGTNTERITNVRPTIAVNVVGAGVLPVGDTFAVGSRFAKTGSWAVVVDDDTGLGVSVSGGAGTPP